MKLKSKRHPDNQREAMPAGWDALKKWAEVYPMEMKKITIPVIPKSLGDRKPLFASDFATQAEVAQAVLATQTEVARWSAVDEVPFSDCANVVAETFGGKMYFRPEVAVEPLGVHLEPVKSDAEEDPFELLRRGIISRKQFFDAMCSCNHDLMDQLKK